MKTEVREMTVLRAIAIVSIFFAHLHGYVDLSVLSKVSSVSANICVALFVFVSGYCLALGKDIVKFREVFDFLWRRLRKIYKLYIPALVLFLVVYEYNDPNKFVSFLIHLASLQVLLAECVIQYRTIWFIGLIVPYYVLFAFSGYMASNNRHLKKAALLVLFFAALYLSRLYIICDSRFFFNAPAFALGVFLCERGYFQTKKFTWNVYVKCAAASVAIIALYVVFKNVSVLSPLAPLAKTGIKIAYVCMIPLSVLLCLQIPFVEKAAHFRLIDILSGCSFSIFLFHRLILTAAQTTFGFLHIENANILFVLYVFIVIPFAVIPIAYAIQKLADREWR
mgnify:CR=1 FL=1